MNDFDIDVQTRSCSEALLILDMISDFEFEDGDKLSPQALESAANIAALKRKAKAADAAVIYVNDNYGRWNEDFHTYTRNVRENSENGRRIIELIEPERDDMFVLKPQRSGFYATPLGVLLLSMGTSRIIIAGVTTDICVLFTAHDAYMRDFHLVVPRDCVASASEADDRYALAHMATVTKADTRPSAEIDFSGLRD